MAPFLEVIENHGVAGNVEIIHADAMKIDWQTFFATRKGNWKMVANLPYNIASPLLITMLEEAPQVKEIFVMVQKEVADRFAAQPGGSSYGIPSVKSQYWSEVTVIGKISPEVFYPIPRVDSALLQLKRRKIPKPVNIDLFNQIVRKAFSQRRKMLRKTIGSNYESKIFTEVGIDPCSRPEELSVENWVNLANRMDVLKEETS